MIGRRNVRADGSFRQRRSGLAVDGPALLHSAVAALAGAQQRHLHQPVSVRINSTSERRNDIQTDKCSCSISDVLFCANTQIHECVITEKNKRLSNELKSTFLLTSSRRENDI